jgi:SAM-dependent methyltransferase
MPESSATGDRFAVMRAKLLAPLTGDVLEIGGGDGPSLQHYSRGIRLTFTEPHADAFDEAVRSEEAPADTEFVRAGLPHLPFHNAAFDAVVEMRVLCSVPDAAGAIAEIRRLLRPGGTFVFMDHVRSPNPVLGLGQDVIAWPWTKYWGCRPNVDTVRIVERAGFAIEWLDRFGWGPPPVRPRVYGVAKLPPDTARSATTQS